MNTWINRLALDGLRKYPVVTGAIAAAILIMLGVYIGTFTGSIADFFSKSLIAAGTALIGAGVFSVISQSSKYVSLIQEQLEHVLNKPNQLDVLRKQIRAEISSQEYIQRLQSSIQDVFVSPEKVTNDSVTLQERWRMLTEARLRNVLPGLFKDAADLLERQFFNSELTYHFEDYSQKFDINIDTNGIASITNTFKAKVIRNRASTQSCVFKQNSTILTGTVELVELEIAGKRVPIGSQGKNYFSSQGQYAQLEIDLSSEPEDCIKIKRVLSYQQDLKTESFMIANVSRYIRGGQLKVRVSGDYDLKFNGIGSLKTDSIASTDVDSEGYKKWVLANSNSLLLPGQGYILVLTPKGISGSGS